MASTFLQYFPGPKPGSTDRHVSMSTPQLEGGRVSPSCTEIHFASPAGGRAPPVLTVGREERKIVHPLSSKPPLG